jgi:predicted transcriptional regulator
LAPLSLPPHLVRFIRSDIHSVLQLEVLLLLRERGGHWSVTELADELRVTAHAVDAHVRDLLGRGLLSHAGELDRYTFDPKDERLRSLVDELWRYDGSMRHTVINLIFPGDRAPLADDGEGLAGPEG